MNIKDGYDDYQDVIVKGEVISKGVRDCNGRYNAIKEFVFKPFNRKIEMLDLGAYSGYFTFRAAHEGFLSKGIMVDARDHLMDLVEQNAYPYVVYEKGIVDLYSLNRSVVYYDVILCLNFLHHFSLDDAKAMFNMLRTRCRCLVVETPNAEERNFQLSTDSGMPLYEHILRLRHIVEDSGKWTRTIGMFPSHLDSDLLRNLTVVMNPGVDQLTNEVELQ